ncbi:MAG: CinA family nicotinamide mononucleotide deamidase-related protein [Kiritimatiellae bacterium]|nr:CinA family nicotinamide mononucleotide deamidase-related protein [Kiritimatiellia bacterium]
MRAAELISTGSELLDGKTVSTHATTLARHLRPLGIPLLRDTTVPDDSAAIHTAVLEASRRVDLVFVSGGLGPTCDDLTREVMLALLGGELVYDDTALERIRRFCERSGRAFTEGRKRQALVLSQAEVIPNGVGAVPGELILQEGICYILLPGPPNEFNHLLENGIMARLASLQGDVPTNHERLFQVSMAEGDLVEALAAVDVPSDGVSFSYCLSEQGVEVRLNGVDGARVEEVARQVREVLGRQIYAEGRTTLEEVVGGLLQAQGATLATAESCTGGLLGDRITGVPGSSAYYLGGMIAYANEVKLNLLNVERDLIEQYGAVSAEVAGRMAENVRRCFNATYGMGITGIAGPGGGTERKPVGLVFVAVAKAGEVRVQRYVFGRERQQIKMISAHKALVLLRDMLLGG